VGEQQRAPTSAEIAILGCDTQALFGLTLLATAAAYFSLISPRHMSLHSSSSPILLAGDLTSRLSAGTGTFGRPPGPDVVILFSLVTAESPASNTRTRDPQCLNEKPSRER